MADDKEPRAAVVIRPLSPGPGVVRVTTGKKVAYYLLRERDADPGAVEPGSRAFAIARLGSASAYHAVTMPTHSCECVGFLARGSCVHSKLLLALSRAGHL